MIVLHVTADGRSCQVEVREGTLADKLKRGSIIQAAVRAQRDSDAPRDVIRSLIELHTYPSCVACSRDLSDSDDPDLHVDGMTFEQFVSLPDQFVEKWATAVFELNPGWRQDEGFPLLRPLSETDSSK